MYNQIVILKLHVCEKNLVNLLDKFFTLKSLSSALITLDKFSTAPKIRSFIF